MFVDKSPDLRSLDYESSERLLAEQEGVLWTEDDDDEVCISTMTIFLQFTALAIVFLIGALFGFFWRADLDGLCGRHVSQYCKSKVYQSTLIKYDGILHFLAPIVNDLDVKYNLESFHGSLLKESIFRQDASLEVDAAWESLGVNCASFITSKDGYLLRI